jgi:hypothetical protein
MRERTAKLQAPRHQRQVPATASQGGKNKDLMQQLTRKNQQAFQPLKEEEQILMSCSAPK